MTGLKSYEMKPFALPADFGDDDAPRAVEFISVDDREHALETITDYAEMLFGDVVLVPFEDGEPDWSNTSRDTLTKFAGHWTELEMADVPRLAVLTDSFDRFLGDGNDEISVVTLWSGGTPDVRQIGGRRSPLAVDLVAQALIDDEPMTLRQKKAPASPAAPPKAANDNDDLFLINPADWHGEPIPVREWFVEGLIPMRQVTILNGDGGTGKSLLALQVAAASALSVDTLGMEPLARRVLYLGAEDEEDEFKRRLADIVKHHGAGFDDLFRFRLMPLADRDALLSIPNNRTGVMEPTLLWHRVVATIGDFKPGLVVLDTAADLFGGDEIKRSQVRQFIAMLRKVAMDIDCAILLLAHPSVAGMQSGTGSSGSTAWSNSVRSRLYLTRPEGKDTDPDARVLTTKKINYGKVGNELRLRWQDGVFVLDDGKPSLGAGILKKRADETFRSLLSAVNRSGQRVASTKGVNYAPTVLAERPDTEGVTKKQFEGAMQRLLAEGLIKVVWEGPPSKQRQRLIVSAEDFGPEEEELSS